MNPGAPEGYAVPAPLVAPIQTALYQPQQLFFVKYIRYTTDQVIVFEKGQEKYQFFMNVRFKKHD